MARTWQCICVRILKLKASCEWNDQLWIHCTVLKQSARHGSRKQMQEAATIQVATTGLSPFTVQPIARSPDSRWVIQFVNNIFPVNRSLVPLQLTAEEDSKGNALDGVFGIGMRASAKVAPLTWTLAAAKREGVIRRLAAPRSNCVRARTVKKIVRADHTQ